MGMSENQHPIRPEDDNPYEDIKRKEITSQTNHQPVRAPSPATPPTDEQDTQQHSADPRAFTVPQSKRTTPLSPREALRGMRWSPPVGSLYVALLVLCVAGIVAITLHATQRDTHRTPVPPPVTVTQAGRGTRRARPGSSHANVARGCAKATPSAATPRAASQRKEWRRRPNPVPTDVTPRSQDRSVEAGVPTSADGNGEEQAEGGLFSP
jgi:hypothetical protein